LRNVEEKWIIEVRHFCGGIPFLLVGCKKDLRHDPRVVGELEGANQSPVTYEEGMVAVQKIGAGDYLECSALTSEGVREVFQHAARAALLTQSKKKSRRTCLVI